jgi:hypothetical protein
MKLIFIYGLLFQHKNNNKNNNFIKNLEYPICKNCIYYKADELFPNDSLLAKCLLFGEQNIVSGKITHHYVDTVRNDRNQCDIKGKFYKENI